MMKRTDRHCRVLLRLVSPRALLYTEMIVDQAVLHGERERFLGFDPVERPLALQVGGSDPAALGRCASLAREYGYDEINLNVGCPSNRVHSGHFGACLMAEPRRVADCVAAMAEQGALPVTVKTRIGTDRNDSYEHLRGFVEQVGAAGCGRFIIHARKAVLDGLSPRQNREVPPLDYERVYRLQRDLPQLAIVINGGIGNIAAARVHLRRVGGVMIGRQAYRDPLWLARLEQAVYDDAPDGSAGPVTSAAVLDRYGVYIEQQLQRGVRLKQMTCHLTGLYRNCPGASAWRTILAEDGAAPGAGLEVVRRARRAVEARLDDAA